MACFNQETAKLNHYLHLLQVKSFILENRPRVEFGWGDGLPHFSNLPSSVEAFKPRNVPMQLRCPQSIAGVETRRGLSLF